MKSKVTKIHPEGAAVTRANGSAVKVGDEVGDGEALTITMRSTGGVAPCGVVTFDGPVVPGIAERFTSVVIPDVVPPVLVVSDTATPPRTARAGGAGGGISRGSPFSGGETTVPPVLKVQ